MAAAVSVSYNGKLKISETLDITGAEDPIVTYTVGISEDTVSNASSSVPKVTKSWIAEDLALDGSGDLELDLTALADGPSGTVDMDGLVVQFLKIVNPVGNDDLVVDEAALTPYLIWGGSGDVVSIPGGSEMTIAHKDGMAAVSATVKLVQFAGGIDQTFSIIIVAGPVTA